MDSEESRPGSSASTSSSSSSNSNQSAASSSRRKSRSKSKSSSASSRGGGGDGGGAASSAPQSPLNGRDRGGPDGGDISIANDDDRRRSRSRSAPSDDDNRVRTCSILPTVVDSCSLGHILVVFLILFYDNFKLKSIHNCPKSSFQVFDFSIHHKHINRLINKINTVWVNNKVFIPSVVFKPSLG